MPPHQAHLAKARENLALYTAKKGDLPPDWQAVVLFYAAVHLIETLCDAVDGGHNVMHQERDEYVRSKHPAIWAEYSRLKKESIKARYLTSSYDRTGSAWQRGSFSLTSEQVETQLRVGALEKIIRYVEERIRVPVVAAVAPGKAEPSSRPS